jgi:hypothetical protein
VWGPGMCGAPGVRGPGLSLRRRPCYFPATFAGGYFQHDGGFDATRGIKLITPAHFSSRKPLGQGGAMEIWKKLR